MYIFIPEFVRTQYNLAYGKLPGSGLPHWHILQMQSEVCVVLLPASFN